MSCSKENSGVWTPITTSPLSPYFFAQARRYGRVRSQLMQVKVQKSTPTTLPRKPAGVSGGGIRPAVCPGEGGGVASVRDFSGPGLGRGHRAGFGGNPGGGGGP